jgi:glycopeptide antibiotics resistance protein
MRLLAAFLLALWLIGSLVLTLQPAHPLPGQVVDDNLVPLHTLAIYVDNLGSEFWLRNLFGNLALLLPLGLLGPIALPALDRWWRIALVALLYSVAIELIQLAVPDRSADIDDVIVNVAGALLGYGGLAVIRRFSSARQPEHVEQELLERSVAMVSLDRQGYVKVRMEDQGFVETLWAVRVVPGKDHFRLDNSPFFAYRVSTEDVVEGRLVTEGFYDFVRVVERSGNRTIRLMFADEMADTSERKKLLDGLVALGCSYEGMFGKVISITVRREVDLGGVAEHLTATGLRWEYADPTYDDLFGTR